MRRILSFPGAVAATVVAALGLAGCGSKGDDSSSALANLFAYNSVKAPPIPATQKIVDVDCPIVQIPDEQGAYRVYSGADKSNSSVRYQFSLGEISRDCSSDGSQIEFRLGVSGYVQAGPAGGPGTFSVPLKIAIVREDGHVEAAGKSFKIEATIPPGETQAVFSLVTDPISVPYISRAADDDYGLYVGFEQGPPEKPHKPEKPARRKKAPG